MLEIPAELLNRHPWVVWVVLGWAVFVKGGALLAEGSEKWAKLLGPIGRRWRNRAEYQAEIQRRSDDSAVRHREIRQAHAEAVIEDLQRQVAYLAGQVGTLRADVEETHDFLRIDAAWHRRFELRAAAEGWEPIDEWLSLAEWVGQRKGA